MENQYEIWKFNSRLERIKAKEVWKDVAGTQGQYMLSNIGEAKSFKWGKERTLKPWLNSRGYLTIDIRINGHRKCRTIHQLMAECFLNHIPCGYELVVEHKNHIRTDNRIDNLEIITQRVNANHKHLKSSSQFTGVSWNKVSKKWVSQIYINEGNIYLGLFNTELEASERYENALKNYLLELPIEIKKRNPSSEFKGISWNEKNKKWFSQIRINGKLNHLGSFNNEIDAYNARQEYIKTLKK